MKVPCETIVWNLLQALRAEIAKSLLNENLSQSDAAERLGLSRAAVCQYLKNKRGNEINLDSGSKKEIELFAKRIAREELSPEETVKGICWLCNKLRKSLVDKNMGECPK